MSEELSRSSHIEFRTRHQWFHSGNHLVLAHVDVPFNPARSGVVIVPPFGWDDICAYRPLRSLAHRMASRGIAVLRFDLPGTGDSSGSAHDHNLVAAWIQSVRDAVAELKATTGVQEVSVLGVRLGAMLSLAAASAGMQVENLILWGASATGRTLLRELRAFRNLEVTEGAEGETTPPPPANGLEVAGFLLSCETERDLESLSALDLPPMPDQKALLLTRDSFPHDNKLLQSLEKAGCRVTLNTGAGYQDMLAAPHEPLSFSPATEQIIWDFIQPATETPDTLATFSHRAIASTSSCQPEEGVLETAFPVPYRGQSLFSVLTQPANASASCDWGLLFMNAGGVRHIGPNRMWVDTARRWAKRGVPSIRIDFQRVGESDCDELANIANLHSDDLVEQLSAAMNSMRSQLGCHHFIAVGLCSGAYAAFQSLIRDSAIRAAVLLNARLFFWDPEIEPRRLAKRVGAGYADLGYWKRLIKGEIQLERIKQAARVAFHNLLNLGRERYIPAEALQRAWRQAKRFQTRVTLVFADGEPLWDEMIAENQMPPSDTPLIRCVGVGKTGHTFRPIWAQQLVQDLIDREIESTVRPHTVCSEEMESFSTLV